MATDEEFLEAKNILTPPNAYGFEWLIGSDVQWYSISEVADAMGIGRETIRKWCEAGEFPNAINYQPQQIGWRILKRDLIIYFAGVKQRSATRDDKPT